MDQQITSPEPFDNQYKRELKKTTTKLVGLVGLKQSGKTTASRFFQNHGFTCIPFASVIKDMLLAFGLSEAQLFGDQKEVPSDILCGQTPRFTMQTLGTEWGRSIIGNDIWLNAWENKMSQHPKVVVDDARFHNEVGLVQDLGGTIIRVTRDAAGQNGDLHVSEVNIPHLDADVHVHNGGTISGLHLKLRAVSRAYKLI